MEKIKEINKSNKNFDEQVSTEHEYTAIKCIICDKSYKAINTLKQHIKTSHTDIFNKFQELFNITKNCNGCKEVDFHQFFYIYDLAYQRINECKNGRSRTKMFKEKL